MPLTRATASTAAAAPASAKELRSLLVEGPEFPHRAKVVARLEKAMRADTLRDRLALEFLSEQVDALEELRPLLEPAARGAMPVEAQQRALDAIDHAQAVIRRQQQSLLERRSTEAERDVSALLVTGDTYPLRRELRGLGGKWNKELGGWVVPADKQQAIDALGEGRKLSSQPVDVKGSALQDLDHDTLRERRQDKKDSRVEALLERADRLDREADEIRANHVRSGYTDWQFITQPILIGHHSEGRMRNLRNKISREMDTEIRNHIEARKLRAQAASIERGGARVRGDARRERMAAPQVRRSDLAPELRPGAIIEAPREFWSGRLDRYPAGTPLEVVRVSPKSVTLRPLGLKGTFDQGKMTLSEVAQAKVKQAAPAKFRVERAPLPSGVVPGARVRVEYMAINRGGIVEKITPTKVLVRLDGDKRAYPVPREFSSITPEGGI
jgi:hypothetical protein